LKSPTDFMCADFRTTSRELWKIWAVGEDKHAQGHYVDPNVLRWVATAEDGGRRV
jgi:hypothetical protein